MFKNSILGHVFLIHRIGKGWLVYVCSLLDSCVHRGNWLHCVAYTKGKHSPCSLSPGWMPILFGLWGGGGEIQRYWTGGARQEQEIPLNHDYKSSQEMASWDDKRKQTNLRCQPGFLPRKKDIVTSHLAKQKVFAFTNFKLIFKYIRYFR